MEKSNLIEYSIAIYKECLCWAHDTKIFFLFSPAV